jgi:hypothetical protein
VRSSSARMTFLRRQRRPGTPGCVLGNGQVTELIDLIYDAWFDLWSNSI